MKLSRLIETFSKTAAVALILAGASHSSAQQVRVSITNNAPAGGVYLTPVWAGFHNGSFDSYDGGSATAAELERLAEDGNTGPLSAVFLADGTLVATGVTQTGTRIDGMLGGAPIAPGQTVSADFNIAMDGTNRYFSYASMVIPSNDYYVANGGPMAHDLQSLDGAPVGTSVSFEIGFPGTINDAGTEMNFTGISGAGDMEDDSVAGLGLLGAGYIGQSAPDTGPVEGGVNANVLSAYAEAPSILAGHPELDFNDALLYPNGIASVTVSVVPEPSTWALLGMSLVAVSFLVRRQIKQT